MLTAFVVPKMYVLVGFYPPSVFTGRVDDLTFKSHAACQFRDVLAVVECSFMLCRFIRNSCSYSLIFVLQTNDQSVNS